MRLLNEIVSYDYNQADQQQEREAVHKFCEALVRAARSVEI